MDTLEALKRRTSIRAFTDKPVEERQVRDILDDARWSPSGGNLQPWKVYVVMGAARERLIKNVKETLAANAMASSSELSIYPPKLEDPWRSRRYEVGEAMYAQLDIPRTDKMARLAYLMRNYEFFGAPVGMFFSIDRRFEKNQWAHLGMFMQSVALVATARGLASCMQESWCVHAGLVSKFLQMPDREQLYCGMALGYADEIAKVNKLRTTREEVDNFSVFLNE